MRVIVIGGNAAGMSAASKLKRNDPNADIIVYELSGETSYGACGLPYFIGGANAEVDRIRIRKPAQFLKSGIDVRLFHQVIAVDNKKRTITVKNLQTGEELVDHYDKLVIGSGANPVMPPFPGRDLAGIFTLKTIDDAERICAKAISGDVKNVVIVGAGYIGMELVEAFWQRGLAVRVIEATDRAMRFMDSDFSDLLEETLARNGVSLHLSERVLEFEGDDFVHAVVTDKGRYDADMVIVCVGVRPNTQFLAGTDIQLTSAGAVMVDEQMQSSDSAVFAAGDCALIINKLTGRQVYLPLGTNANKQGKVLGDVLYGKPVALQGVLGTSMCRVIDLELARTGLNEEDAKAAGIPCVSVLTEASNAPPYYPEKHCPLRVKLFYHPETHVILGFQLAGKHGAGSRIGACALAVEAKMTCETLAMADMGYAPPVTFVWDPIQVAAGMVK